jgi:hypothetical protein
VGVQFNDGPASTGSQTAGDRAGTEPVRLNLALVLHNHQPVGNDGFVFDDVYRRAYHPLLECLDRHPSIRLAMHRSGCLFDRLEANHPDYLDLLRALADRGQVELVSGGYYEPILSMLAEDDRVGQIKRLSSYIRERFGQQPTGMWLAERVWEPEFAWAIDQAGLDWTLVDDRHFKLVGLRDEDLDGAFVTEDQGRHVHSFAGSQRLRYIIPWREVDEVIAELRGLAREDPSTLVVLGGDGEKFGSWPTTYEYVWERGWMRSARHDRGPAGAGAARGPGPHGDNLLFWLTIGAVMLVGVYARLRHRR